ncbi:mosc domain protein [hydrocarbon metagenome]|uniref:Mosc domain protein n=1 Tax=hydrocarbon metagenome TaxID=938273 RepID=A0A0W8E1H6_9ZZZZ
MEGKILAINITEKNSGKRRSVEEAVLSPGQGIGGDDASGQNNGEISMISQSTYEQMREMGVDFFYGDFGENLRVDGLTVGRLPVGSQVKIGEAVLEVLENDNNFFNHYVTVRGYAGELTILPDKIHASVVIGGNIKADDKIRVLQESLRQ